MYIYQRLRANFVVHALACSILAFASPTSRCNWLKFSAVSAIDLEEKKNRVLVGKKNGQKGSQMTTTGPVYGKAT